MRSSPRYRTMSDSPFVGWIVPHPWQEPYYDKDEEETDEEIDDWSDYDPESELTIS